MNKILTLGFCLLAAACSPSGENDNASSSDNALESSGDKVVTKKGGDTCSGWICGQENRRVTDDEVFELVLRYESDLPPPEDPTEPDPTPSKPNDFGGSSSGDTSTPAGRVVRLSAIECVSVPEACTRSCAIRTVCGGGGHVNEKDSATLANWIRQKGARDSGPSWAKRAATGAVSCTKTSRPGAKATCKVSLDDATPDNPGQN